MKGGASVGGPPMANFELSCLWKRDFCHSEAKLACSNFSFYKVKVPFFFL